MLVNAGDWWKLVNPVCWRMLVNPVCWRMLINPVKTKDLVIARSKTIAPIFPHMLLEGVVVKRVTELKVLDVVSFEGHNSLIAASVSSKPGIMRKSLCLFDDQVLDSWCFWSFLLPVLEYCSPV